MDKIEKPELVPFPDLDSIRDYLEKYTGYIWSDEYSMEGGRKWEFFMYETVMEAFYGKDVWDQINKKRTG